MILALLYQKCAAPTRRACWKSDQEKQAVTGIDSFRVIYKAYPDMVQCHCFEISAVCRVKLRTPLFMAYQGRGGTQPA